MSLIHCAHEDEIPTEVSLMYIYIYILTISNPINSNINRCSDSKIFSVAASEVSSDWMDGGRINLMQEGTKTVPPKDGLEVTGAQQRSTLA